MNGAMIRGELRRLVVYRCLDAFAAALHVLAMQSESLQSFDDLARSAKDLNIAIVPHEHLRRFAWSLFHDSYRLLRRHGAALHDMWDIVEGAKPLPDDHHGWLQLTSAMAVTCDNSSARLYQSLCGDDILALNAHLDTLPADQGPGWRGALGANLLAEILEASVRPPGEPYNLNGPAILYLAMLHARILHTMLPPLTEQLNLLHANSLAEAGGMPPAAEFPGTPKGLRILSQMKEAGESNWSSSWAICCRSRT